MARRRHAMCRFEAMRPRRFAIFLLSLGGLVVLAVLMLRAFDEPGGGIGDLWRQTADGRTPDGLAQLAGRAQATPEPAGSEPGRRRAVASPPSHDVVAYLVGTVVDTEGQPVERAAVHFRRSAGVRVEDRTDESGRYRMRVYWKGEKTLHARADRFGTGTLKGVVVDHDGDTEAPPLVLRGAGWFSGIVVFPDGAPADGVAVEAAVSMARGGSWDASPEPGLIHSISVTDAKGRFRCSGLRLGPYVATAPRVTEQDVRIWADHGQRNVRIVLRSRRVRIDPRNEDDRPVPEVEVKITRNWSVQCKWGYSRSRRPDDVLEVWGHPGDRDILHFRAEGYRVKEHIVEFDESTWSRDETVVLTQEDGERGRVALSLRRQDGTWVRELSAGLRSASGIYRVPDFRRVDGDAEDVVELPPGRWTLEIVPTAALEDDGYEGYDFPARGTIEVVTGERSDLSLVSRLGGRVRVLAKRGPGLDPKVDLTVGFMLLVPPERADDRELDAEDLGWFWDDTPNLSPIVAPGPWLLEIEGEGVHDELRPIVARAGHTLDVHVTLVPDSRDEDVEEAE